MKKLVLTALKILFAILVFWYLFWSGRLSLENVLALLSLKNFPFIAIAGLAIFASNFLAALRLIYLLRTIRLPVSLSQSLKMTLVGVFFNSVIPGMTGGDIIKGYYLIKAEGEQRGKSSGIVILDRVMGLFAIVFIAGLSAVYLLYYTEADLGRYQDALQLTAVVVLVMCLLFLSVIILGSTAAFREMVKQHSRRFFKQGMLYRVIEGLGKSLNDRPALLRAFLLSLTIQVITLAGVLVLARMVSGELKNIIPLMVASSLVFFFGVVPVTPGNIGWTELLGSLGWSLVGSDIGGVVFLYWRIVGILACSLPGGIIYAAQSHTLHEMKKNPSQPAA